MDNRCVRWMGGQVDGWVDELMDGCVGWEGGKDKEVV